MGERETFAFQVAVGGAVSCYARALTWNQTPSAASHDAAKYSVYLRLSCGDYGAYSPQGQERWQAPTAGILSRLIENNPHSRDVRFEVRIV